MTEPKPKFKIKTLIIDTWFRRWCSQVNHFSWVYLAKLPFRFICGCWWYHWGWTWGCVFKYLLLTSSSDISLYLLLTQLICLITVLLISQIPLIYSASWKSPLKSKQSATSPAMFRKVTILESFERRVGGEELCFQHGVECENNLGIEWIHWIYSQQLFLS